jgi:cell wall-associated NlpC family hydrolase
MLVGSVMLCGCAGMMGDASTESGIRNPHDARLSEHARSFIGISYRLGGSGRAGMDCSGLVVRLFSDVHRLSLPHSTAALRKIGNPVTLRSLKIGDLVFFREERGKTPSHVGVYLGNGTFIHATVSRGVIVSKLNETYYRKRYAAARRIVR